LYVSAPGVTGAAAHSWTVTTLELVTAALKMMSGLGNDPSAALTDSG